MATELIGRRDWGLDIDDEGHRTYDISWLVRVDDPREDGPWVAGQAPGLPLPGVAWRFGNDNDPWAYMYPTMKVSPLVTGEPFDYWTVDQKFGTRPINKCSDDSFQNPLTEPMRIGGTFQKFTEEVGYDRNGKIICNSAFEPFKGQEVEFERNKPTVSIGMNLPYLPLSTFAPMIDNVNAGEMWGLSKRMVKLSNVKWERKVYGTCFFYYSIDYEFDVDYRTFDRYLANYGTKELGLGGDAANPAHFQLSKDGKGDTAKFMLTTSGQKATSLAQINFIKVEVYPEANFFSLGIPGSL